MGQLVQDGHNATLTSGIGNCGAENVVLGEGHRASVFHCTGVEVWDPELVVLLKWVRNTKQVLKEVKALLGLFEDVIGIHVLPK